MNGFLVALIGAWGAGPVRLARRRTSRCLHRCAGLGFALLLSRARVPESDVWQHAPKVDRPLRALVHGTLRRDLAFTAVGKASQVIGRRRVCSAVLSSRSFSDSRHAVVANARIGVASAFDATADPTRRLGDRT